MTTEERLSQLELEIGRQILELRLAYCEGLLSTLPSSANRIARLAAEYVALEKDVEEALP